MNPYAFWPLRYEPTPLKQVAEGLWVTETPPPPSELTPEQERELLLGSSELFKRLLKESMAPRTEAEDETR